MDYRPERNGDGGEVENEALGERDECYGVALQTQSAQILPVNTGYRVVVFHMVYAGTDWRANQEYFKNGLGKVHCGHLNKLIPQTMAPDSCHPNWGEMFSPL